MATRYPLDRSAAFTALLDLDPQGFGREDMDTSSVTITRFLEDWYRSADTNMYEFARRWLAKLT
jgi:hypothetical protein